LEYQHKHATRLAFDSFKKADKQDGGHCLPCQNEMVEDGIEFQEWNTAEAAASEIVSEAQGDKAIAIAHYGLGVVKMREGMAKRKDEFFSQAHDEFSRALASAANFPNAMYADGITLAHLKQDDAAKLRFEQFVRIKPEGDTDRQRAHGARFCDHHHRWATSHTGRSEGQGGLNRFLGRLVSVVPGGRCRTSKKLPGPLPANLSLC